MLRLSALLSGSPFPKLQLKILLLHGAIFPAPRAVAGADHGAA